MIFDEDYDPSDYYEPSDADDILNEAFEGIENILKSKVKQKYGHLEEKAESLRKDRKELNKKESELLSRERQIEIKERDLEVEFNKRKLSDVYDELMKSFGTQFFMIKTNYTRKDKCNLCDNNRKVKAKMPCGGEVEVCCSCDYRVKTFSVEDDFYIKLVSWKNSHSGGTTRKLKYSSRNSDDHYFSDIDLDKIIDVFDEDLKDPQYKKFSTRELAQKYCDLLNENENNNK